MHFEVKIFIRALYVGILSVSKTININTYAFTKLLTHVITDHIKLLILYEKNKIFKQLNK